MAKPQNIYGSTGGVPSINPSGQGQPTMSVRANPNDMGGQIGAALQDTGKKAADLSIQYGEQVSEAKANDSIANKIFPEALKLRNKYDSLRGADKIHGYEEYTTNLRDLKNTSLQNASNPVEKQILDKYLTSHIMQEESSASRELVASQKEFSDTSALERMDADSLYAAINYNNPEVVNKVRNSNKGLITINALDNGVDPNTEEGKDTLEQAYRQADGKMGVDMIDRAVSTGDVASAYKIRSEYISNIPGNMQIQIGNKLHFQSMQQVGVTGVTSLTNGKPIPEAVGSPPAKVQAVVADTAQVHGVDANHALAVARIESNYGQNVGKRGDIGQTGRGGDISEQAANMVTELKKSSDVAAKAVGRVPEKWEEYLCYQQGEGGGPALLNAPPTSKAVDALRPLYKNPKDALSAIINNGGNATMSVSDFCDLIKKKYDNNAKRAAIEIPTQQTSADGTILGQTTPSIGDAIMAPHTTDGPVVQPGATPLESLANFDKRGPDMLARINAIPNYEVREGIMKAYENKRAVYTAAATAYKSSLNHDIITLGSNKQFTSMDQVPPDMMAALAEQPKLMTYLEKQAKRHTEGETISKNDPNVIWMRGELQSMKYNDPKAFMNYDFTDVAGKLPGEEILSFQKEAAEMRAGKTISASEADQNNTIKDAEEMGFIKGSKEVAQFRDAFNTRIQAFEEATGKKPTWKDLQGIKDDLVTEVAFKGWGNDKKLYKITEEDDLDRVNVPEEMNDQIIEALKAEDAEDNLDQPISDERIKQRYIQFLKNKLR